VELFTDFYNEGSHAASVRYLYFGLHGLNSPAAVYLDGAGDECYRGTLLSIHPLRKRRALLNIACVLAFVGIWIEKGYGVCDPGFHSHTAWGGVRVQPDAHRATARHRVSGRCAILVFTLLAKASIAIALGDVRAPARRASAAAVAIQNPVQ
jgi:hypothetical protein